MFKAPATVEAPRMRAFVSTSVALLEEITETVLKLFVPVSRVMLLPPAVRNVVPVTASVPLSVNSPPSVTFNAPETVEAPRIKALVSTSVALFAEMTETVLKALLPSSSVMLLPVTFRLVVPVTATVPLSVRSPFAVMVRSPDTMEAPRINAFVSTSVALFEDTIDTVPKLLLASSSVMLFPVAFRLAAPVTASVPLSVSSPLEVAFRSPPMVEAEKSISCAFTIVALPEAPFVVRPIEPVTFRLPRSMMAFEAEVVNEPSPPTTTLPLSDRLPVVTVTVRSPVTEEAPRSRTLLSTRVELFAEIIATVPKLLAAVSSVMLFEPAVRKVVPVTATVPLSVSSPLEVAFRSPPMVEAARSMP